jgi:hypothetical protein
MSLQCGPWRTKSGLYSAESPTLSLCIGYLHQAPESRSLAGQQQHETLLNEVDDRSKKPVWIAES